MLVDASLPRGSDANLVVVGSLSEGFGRIVISPPYLVGYVRWDARTNQDHLLVRQSFQQLFRSQSPKSTPTVSRSGLGPSSARGPASAGLADVAFTSSFPCSFSTSSASSSLGSRCTGRPAFTRFAFCSFFIRDLLFFFKGRSPYPSGLHYECFDHR